MNVVRLSPASPTADLRALEEVSDFATTDMGWGGEERWTYRKLKEEEVIPEILRISHHGLQEDVDYITFQPCMTYESRSQDRFVVQNWDLQGKRWTFTAIFDGHGSHDTVDFVVEYLPARVRRTLQSTLTNGTASPASISGLLRDAIIETDNAITNEFLRLFPEGREGISRLSDREIESRVRNNDRITHPAIRRCMSGSTALLSLVDPTKTQLWVANLGDCRAVLISKHPNGSYIPQRLSEVHNGGNDRELQRIRDKHPRERECVVERRVLGFLAPTKALGDTWLKLPPEYSRRVLMKTREFWAAGLSEEYIRRIHSPPYVSNTPQVYQHCLRSESSRRRTPRTATTAPPGRGNNQPHHNGEEFQDVALLLCSDGLVDLYEDQDIHEKDYLKLWAAKIGEILKFPDSPYSPRSPSRQTPATRDIRGDNKRENAFRSSQNIAVQLLRDAIGGDDLTKVSANLTVEMDERWMDDTTILVQRFE